MFKKYTSTIILSALLFCFYSCEESLDKSILYGTWQAVAFNENGSAKDMDVRLLQFGFSENVYTYQGNLGGKEAGPYRLEGNLFYSTDTLKDQRMEKVVRIAYLTKDTMRIEMNKGGVDQEIVLVKK